MCIKVGKWNKSVTIMLVKKTSKYVSHISLCCLLICNQRIISLCAHILSLKLLTLFKVCCTNCYDCIWPVKYELLDQSWDDEYTGKQKYSVKIICLDAIFPPNIFTRNTLRSKTLLHDDRPASNCLSYSRVSKFWKSLWFDNQRITYV